MPHYFKTDAESLCDNQKAIANLLPDRRSRTSTNALHAVGIGGTSGYRPQVPYSPLWV